MTLAAAAAFAAAVGALTAADVESPQSRVSPPASVTCPRDHLTAYTGAVTRLTREPQRTILQIRTAYLPKA